MQAGTPTSYHADQLVSIRALTDGAGAVVNTYTYDAYGQTTSSSAAVDNPFGYAGAYLDSESGLCYLRARYYDPSTQQFLSRDSMLTELPYAYVDGSPLNAVHPTGRFAWAAALPLAALCPECVPIALGIGAIVLAGWLAWNLGNALRDWYDSSQVCLTDQ